ncbi:nucleotide sugar dehydrogenase, partial [bacterium]|nr:nucleotide sugar dehydrogenase [bacterium]
GELQNGQDLTGEVREAELLRQPTLTYSSDPKALSECGVIIVAVPTPVDVFHKPDLSPLIGASTAIGKILKPGMVVVYESTVYPGVTEGECREVLENESGLKFNQDFFLGYSPERNNPGDPIHTPDKMVKVVSGSTPETCELLALIYGAMTEAGVHRAPSIKVAEASKITENIQRDVNIALMNELAMLFDALKIPTGEVLEAARTKWNFLGFHPGLVGGHCIGVDPYYMTHLAEKLGQPASLIATSRNTNEHMPGFIAQKTVSLITQHAEGKLDTPLSIGILGAAFKENVPDTRNSKVADLANALERFGCQVHVVDPLADAESFEEEYHRKLVSLEKLPTCHALVVAVRHDVFVKSFRAETFAAKLKNPRVVVDCKNMLDPQEALRLGLRLWRL